MTTSSIVRLSLALRSWATEPLERLCASSGTGVEAARDRFADASATGVSDALFWCWAFVGGWPASLRHQYRAVTDAQHGV